jgi:hypothetical protein
MVLRTVMPRLRKERKLRAAAVAIAWPAIDTTTVTRPLVLYDSVQGYCAIGICRTPRRPPADLAT